MAHQNKGKQYAMIGSEPLDAHIIFRTEQRRKNRYLAALKQQHHEGVTLREAITPLLDKWADEILGVENE